MSRLTHSIRPFGLAQAGYRAMSGHPVWGLSATHEQAVQVQHSNNQRGSDGQYFEDPDCAAASAGRFLPCSRLMFIPMTTLRIRRATIPATRAAVPKWLDMFPPAFVGLRNSRTGHVVIGGELDSSHSCRDLPVRLGHSASLRAGYRAMNGAPGLPAGAAI